MELENTNNTENMEDHILDGAWDNDDADDFDADVGTEGGQEPADQQAQEQQAQQEQPKADQPAANTESQMPELFTIKNRDETRQVTREELIAMAQKGWDYDTVRQERDQLRQRQQQNDPALNFLTAQAQKNGMDVPQYLRQIEKQELMRRGMSDQEAERELDVRSREAAIVEQQAKIDAYNTQKANAERAAQDREANLRRDMTSFLKAYPEVKAESIPAEVWTKVAQGVPLINAYTMYENAQLKAQLAAERQNKANQQRTPGALGGNAAAEMDEFDRYWNEDD